jgi:hypothetical protein
MKIYGAGRQFIRLFIVPESLAAQVLVVATLPGTLSGSAKYRSSLILDFPEIPSWSCSDRTGA